LDDLIMMVKLSGERLQLVAKQFVICPHFTKISASMINNDVLYHWRRNAYCNRIFQPHFC